MDLTKKAAAAAAWYKNLKSTTNTAFFPLYFDKARYLVLKGGAGSGKSIFAGRKILERVTAEPGHRFLVCRKVAKSIRESCFRQLCEQAAEHYSAQVSKIKNSDLKIEFSNGSVILFAGLDDPDKLKSIYDITGVWIEEAAELLEADFKQLDIRLRTNSPYYLQMILTFNPVSILHWLKKRFFDEKAANVSVHESNYKSNRFLNSEAIKVLEDFAKTDEYFYTVYCLGEWGVVGNPVFNAAAVTKRLTEIVPPLDVGYFDFDFDGLAITSPKFVSDDIGGYIKIYEPPRPGVPYVIGGDTAGDGSDKFVAQVIDNTTGRQVCVLRRTFDEDIYSKQVFCLGKYYNNALVAIEANYSTFPIKELERLGYTHMYIREREDTYTHSNASAWGVITGSKTRPVIIAGLIRAVREDITIINDKTTLEEMLTFVRNEHFRPEAQSGAFDDCIMALGIAHYAREQQSTKPPEAEKAKVKWYPDQYEDYYSATPEERKEIIKLWGNPF